MPERGRDIGASSSVLRASGAASQPLIVSAASAPIVAPPGYSLVWADEFTSAPDGANYEFFPVWGDNNDPEEDEAFLEGSTATSGHSGYSASALSVSGGNLLITASATSTRYGGQTFPYRGGFLRTKTSYLYGYFEVRAKTPPGQGVYQVIWMMPPKFDDIDIWEVDVAEVPETSANGFYSNRHYGFGYDTVNHHKALEHHGTNISSGFHTWGMEWQPGLLRLLLDGVEFREITDHVPDMAMQLIVNLSLGGPSGWVADFDGTTTLPLSLELEHVRIFQ